MVTDSINMLCPVTLNCYYKMCKTRSVDGACSVCDLDPVHALKCSKLGVYYGNDSQSKGASDF